MNIYDLISRAQKLRKETQLDSVSPDRVGGLHEDTLKYINEFQLLASSPSLHKIYASVSAMQSDGAPKSDLTGKPLKPGQLVVIVPASQSDATAGDVYRYDGPSGNTSAWTFVAKIGAVPADAELSATSTNPPQNKVVTEKLTELESETIYKNELNRSGKDFPIKGVVQSDGAYVENASSAYSMNKAIVVKNGESLTFVGYGTTSAAAMALYGDAQLAILWKTLPYTLDDETKPQSVTFNNKTGRTIHVILSTKNALKSYYFYGSCQTNEIGFEDIYHERGVCIYSSKTYMCVSNSPYTTYFIPVKAGDKLFTKVGVYNSGFRIWACNEEKQFMDSPINKRGEQAYNDKSVLTELSVIVPIGVDYIGVTNRADEHTDIMIRRSEYYANNIPSRDYRLSPQEGRVAFIIDGGYDKDAELKALFDAKGVKAGWALLYPWVISNHYGMGVNYAQYLDWQAEGHEIDVHSGSAATYNDIDYAVPCQSEEQKKFAAMRHKEFSDIGFIPRAFVQLGSQHGGLPTEQSRKPIYYSFEFGFTRATNTITEKDKGAVMMPSDKPWNLGRSTLEVITLEQMKGLIDECAEKKGFLCIYAHSWRIGNVQYPNQTWDTFAEMIDYAKSKCVIDTPYNCVKALYANHIE